MKNIFNKLLITLVFATLVFGLCGCSDLFSNFGSSKKSSSSGSSGSSGLTINFNGGTLDGKSYKTFTSEDIAPFVGMNINVALYELNFGIENLQKDGSILLGYTRTKDGNDYVDLLPTFGTIFARWNTTSGSGGSSSGGGSGSTGGDVLVTFDLNGGYVFDEQGNASESAVEMYVSSSDYLDQIQINPYRNGYSFVGWTLTRNGSDVVQMISDIPSSGDKILYAKWQDNLSLFVNGDIVGDFTADENGLEDAQPLNYLGNGIYTYQFTYDSSIMDAWGSQSQYGPNTVRFKLRPNAGDWSISYGCSGGRLIINGDGVSVSRLVGSDIVVSNLQDGVTYTIQVEVTNSGECYVIIYTADYGNTGGNNGGSSEPEYPSEPEDPPSEPEIPSEIQSLATGSMKIDYVTDGNNYSFYCYAGSSYTVDWYDDYDRSTLLDELLSENGISGSGVDIKVSVYSSDGDELCSTKDSGPYTFTANYTGLYYIYVEPYSSGDSGYFAIFVE